MSLPERISSRIERTPDGCWLWTGAIKANGYGKTTWEGKSAYAHRVVYAAIVRPIPEGLELDHICKVRRCVNPEHLRVATRAEQLENRTHCKRGHLLDGDNVAIRSDNGGRRCLTCAREAKAAYVKRHPERHRESKRRWREANRDRVRAYGRGYMRDFREGKRRSA